MAYTLLIGQFMILRASPSRQAGAHREGEQRLAFPLVYSHYCAPVEDCKAKSLDHLFKEKQCEEILNKI